ncbi:MAG: C39 family peptidase [bacterium]
MKLEVPFYSQFSPEIKTDWQERVCALACVKMVLDFSLDKIFSVNDLLEEGLLIKNSFTTEYGWSHDAVVMLLRNHGLSSYRQEFRAVEKDIVNKIDKINPVEKDLIDFALGKIQSSIIHGEPVIVSVWKKFSIPDKLHLVLVIGFEEENDKITGFYVNDPMEDNITEKGQFFVPMDKFRAAWRKFAIFTERLQK